MYGRARRARLHTGVSSRRPSTQCDSSVARPTTPSTRTHVPFETRSGMACANAWTVSFARCSAPLGLRRARLAVDRTERARASRVPAWLHRKRVARCAPPPALAGRATQLLPCSRSPQASQHHARASLKAATASARSHAPPIDSTRPARRAARAVHASPPSPWARCCARPLPATRSSSAAPCRRRASRRRPARPLSTSPSPRARACTTACPPAGPRHASASAPSALTAPGSAPPRPSIASAPPPRSPAGQPPRPAAGRSPGQPSPRGPPQPPAPAGGGRLA